MKVPSTAKKVFKGIVFDVYQWQQKMFDGSEETFEMLKRANTVDVIAIKDGKILLSHQSQPTKSDYYCMFGGRAEEAEDSLTTAKRELLEESGLTSDNWELYKIYHPLHKIDWEVHTYIARNCKKTADQDLGVGEKIEILECNFEEFIEILLSDKFASKDLALDVLRMKAKGKLDQFKEKLIRNS